ncbi:MAG TPA: hypothetical protein VFT88_14080 [Acidobacteriaceae bacterium]|nr:hypothetical protein [Acidobacteriaceae bacterium]
MPDELDQLLNEAIKSYAAAKPSADLAGRILRQAQLHNVSPRRGWKLALALALPVAAAVALGFVLLGPWTLPKPPMTVATAPSVPSVIQRAKTLAAVTEPVPAHRRVRKASSRSSWARPLPPPYSKEELALLNFVQQHPKEAAEIAESQKNEGALAPPQPIKIAPLKTEPITIAALN